MTTAGESFATRLVRWQRSHGRNHLPWQNTRDPYRVWLSEIMLQQTQVATVLEYFDRFLARFPDVKALAAADQDDVLGLWSGLGYYSRARNLHRCAQDVVERFAGHFPSTAAQLQTLPGIGRSTAAAIASFCFGERVAILDGNVKRVLTRWLGFEADLARAANERELWDGASRLLPERSADMPSYTQGIMDLGATVCLSRSPSCLVCPVASDCVARLQGRVQDYPVRTRTLRRSSVSLWLLWAWREDGAVWLHKRAARGVWAGLYSLPAFDNVEDLNATVPPSLRESAIDFPAFVHVLTHRDLHLHPVRVQMSAGQQPGGEGAWVSAQQWPALGLPAPVRRLLQATVAPD
ncbi:MAG: A/G-specific adenine glycosylase [Burkholderiales bacterium]|nr:A/G-specific adenine glycosylase [Burkholderiales bacterium]